MAVKIPVQDEPKLAPPGAGIPLLARLLVRYVVILLQTRNASWERSIKLFEKEGSRILQAVERREPNELEARMLVDPIRGLEDSSRFWSVHMTLEHLMIVGNGMGDIIVKLSNGETLSMVVRTAEVKPQGLESSKVILERYSAFMKELPLRIQSKLGDLNSKTTHPHPWFGPLTAKQWLWLLGVHQNIHRVQIQAIFNAMKSAKG